MGVAIRHKGKLAATWTSENPVLLARQLGFETNTKKCKLGDGTTAWNSLPYNYYTVDEIDTLLSDKEDAGAAAAAIVTLRDGVTGAGDTLQKLYNMIISLQTSENVDDIAERNALNATIGLNVFVTDDGDGNWALYRATTSGVSATYVKLSDPDLLNAVMSNAAIKSAYESNADTNAFTNALLTKLNGIAASATANATDAQLRDRSTHTGSQLISTISDSTVAGKNLVKLTSPATSSYYMVNADGSLTPKTLSELKTDLAIVDTISYAIDPNSDQVNASTVGYYNPYAGSGVDGSEATRQGVMPIYGVVKRLFVVTRSTQSATGDLIITVRKNGADTALTITIPAGQVAGTFFDITHSFTIVAGDMLSIEVDNQSTAASAQLKNIAFIVERT